MKVLFLFVNSNNNGNYNDNNIYYVQNWLLKILSLCQMEKRTPNTNYFNLKFKIYCSNTILDEDNNILNLEHFYA